MVVAVVGVGATAVGVAIAGRVSDCGAAQPAADTAIAAASQTVEKREMILIILRL